MSDLYNNIWNPGSIITTGTGNGIWSRITADDGQTDKSLIDLLEKRVEEILLQMDKLELDNKLLRLKILSMEGKFTQEEVSNIRKMLISEDEASKTLANTIIENA